MRQGHEWPEHNRVEQVRHGAIRIGGLVYALTAFAGTWLLFTYFVLFAGNLPRRSAPWVLPSADVAAGSEPGLIQAIAIDLGLIALFALQHSLMARQSWKRRLTAWLPSGLERATYVHMANATAFLMLALWQPIPAVIWHVDGALEHALWLSFTVGWLLLFSAAFAFGISELLGLRQALAWFWGEPSPALKMKTRGPYRYLSHPMYVGLLTALWSSPYMTAGHALFATALTGYILIALRYETRDLHRRFGRAYGACRIPTPPSGSHPHIGRRMPALGTSHDDAER